LAFAVGAGAGFAVAFAGAGFAAGFADGFAAAGFVAALAAGVAAAFDAAVAAVVFGAAVAAVVFGADAGVAAALARRVPMRSVRVDGRAASTLLSPALRLAPDFFALSPFSAIGFECTVPAKDATHARRAQGTRRNRSAVLL
jgi:hypothetical protein